jgi:hypothetical protein
VLLVHNSRNGCSAERVVPNDVLDGEVRGNRDTYIVSRSPVCHGLPVVSVSILVRHLLLVRQVILSRTYLSPEARMASPLSIGDIISVCDLARKTYTKFKDAPTDFRTAAREIGAMNDVLTDIQRQSEQQWSPLKRDPDSAKVMRSCVADCRSSLQQLSDQMSSYHSLGSDTPELSERAQYMIKNFDPLREKLRQDRAKIDTQLKLCTTDMLSQILKIVSERAEDERTGRKQTVVSSRGETDDDTLTTVTADLQRQNIPSDAIQQHRPQIIAYIEELRKDGEFDEDPRTELCPLDSISEIGSHLSATPSTPVSAASSIGPLSLSAFRSIPIFDLSFGTIFNPHVSQKDMRIAGTFDVWHMASTAWSLQRRLTQDVSGLAAKDYPSRDDVLAILAEFDPVLVLVLAISSTRREFFQGDVSRLPGFGRSILRVLETIKDDLDSLEARERRRVTAHPSHHATRASFDPAHLAPPRPSKSRLARVFGRNKSQDHGKISSVEKEPVITDGSLSFTRLPSDIHKHIVPPGDRREELRDLCGRFVFCYLGPMDAKAPINSYAAQSPKR